MSLSCLFLALGVGVLKEIRTAQEGAKATAAANDARAELDRQGQVALLTSLGNSDQMVQDVQFFVPFTDKGTEASNIHDAALPVLSVPACADTTIEIGLWLGKDEANDVTYRRGDSKDRHEYFDEEPARTDMLIHPDDEFNNEAMVGILAMNGYIGQATTNYRAIGVSVYLLDEKESAAHFIYPNKPLHLPPLTIQAHIPEKIIQDDALQMAKNKKYTPTCSAEVKKYFETAFDRAYVGITLSKNTSVAIFYKLQSQGVDEHRDGWSISFASDLKPSVLTNADLEKLLKIDWPEKPPKRTPAPSE